MLTVSRYLTISETDFTSAQGVALRPAYLATTGRLYMIDKDTAEALNDESGLERKIRPDVLEDLIDAGAVIPDSVDELEVILEENRRAIAENRTRTFVIMPTSYCNLGCSYCGQAHTKATLRGSHRSGLVRRIIGEIESGCYDGIALNWFGGEPLMGYANIRDIARQIVPLADDRGLSYWSQMVTNGVLLDARKLDTLYHDCRVSFFEITLDGTSHDLLRPKKAGGESLDRIVNFLSWAVRQPQYEDLRISIRTNVSPANRGEAAEFARTMAERGLGHDKVSFYAAPIHSWGNDISALELGKTAYGNVELEWLQAYRDAGLNCPSLVPTQRKKIVCIAMQTSAEIITSSGEVFSCTEQPLVSGYEDTAVGNVISLRIGRRPAGLYETWNDEISSGNHSCATCAILPVCGGSCPKAWAEGRSPCPATKFNLGPKLDMYASTHGFERSTAGDMRQNPDTEER